MVVAKEPAGLDASKDKDLISFHHSVEFENGIEKTHPNQNGLRSIHHDGYSNIYQQAQPAFRIVIQALLLLRLY